MNCFNEMNASNFLPLASTWGLIKKKSEPADSRDGKQADPIGSPSLRTFVYLDRSLAVVPCLLLATRGLSVRAEKLDASTYYSRYLSHVMHALRNIPYHDDHLVIREPCIAVS